MSKKSVFCQRMAGMIINPRPSMTLESGGGDGGAWDYVV